ncbi:MAG: carbamate kinase [Vampirovibrionales bacterium]|nr:carbamate kinase [Vampirovibrionales bacterium]
MPPHSHSPASPPRILMAIGGNALYNKQTGDNLSTDAIQAVCKHIVAVIHQGYLPVITFGNGPQVGSLLDMAETAITGVSAGPRGRTPITLDRCVAWTQGEIGYAISQTLQQLLARERLPFSVIAVNTRVEVDPLDPAFQKPTKPVGHFISPEDAQRLYEERGWIVGPDSNRGYRRLVPSPRPMAIVEAEAIGALIDSGAIVLCGGGGGIPVSTDGRGVEAVIDKDFTSCLLAKTLSIENLLIATDVSNIYLDFGQPTQRALTRVTVSDGRRYFEAGEFAAGSMGPKVSALLDYVASAPEGKPFKAWITQLSLITEAIAGKAGTEFYPG